MHTLTNFIFSLHLRVHFVIKHSCNFQCHYHSFNPLNTTVNKACFTYSKNGSITYALQTHSN